MRQYTSYEFKKNTLFLKDSPTRALFFRQRRHGVTLSKRKRKKNMELTAQITQSLNCCNKFPMVPRWNHASDTWKESPVLRHHIETKRHSLWIHIGHFLFLHRFDLTFCSCFFFLSHKRITKLILTRFRFISQMQLTTACDSSCTQPSLVKHWRALTTWFKQSRW